MRPMHFHHQLLLPRDILVIKLPEVGHRACDGVVHDRVFWVVRDRLRWAEHSCFSDSPVLGWWFGFEACDCEVAVGEIELGKVEVGEFLLFAFLKRGEAGDGVVVGDFAVEVYVVDLGFGLCEELFAHCVEFSNGFLHGEGFFESLALGLSLEFFLLFHVLKHQLVLCSLLLFSLQLFFFLGLSDSFLVLDLEFIVRLSF